MNRVFDFITNADEEAKMMFANDVDLLIQDVYFNRFWKDDSMSFSRSGSVLQTEVNLLRGKRVLDVGCGNNHFKDGIYDLVGIDPLNNNADQNKSLLQYHKENPNDKFDVLLALDTFNVGRKQDIIHSFEIMDKMTNTGGYHFWRVNHGEPPVCPEFPLLDLLEFYQWDEKFITELAEFNGYEVKEICEETNNSGEKRLFFCFYKY